MAASSGAIGPSLPPGFEKHNESGSSSDSDSDSSDGSESEKSNVKSAIGPGLPPGMKKRSYSSDEDGDYNKRLKTDIDQIGPSLPPGFQMPQTTAGTDSESGDDDVIGPRLPGTTDAESNESEAAQFERRAEHMKNKLLGKDKVVMTRETWMTELPEKLGSSLGMPVAKTRFGDGKKKMNRSGWTETPQEKEKRLLEGRPEPSEEEEEIFQFNPAERDKEMQEAVELFKRPDSLLDMHQKKLDKKKKKKEKKERKKEKKKNKKKEKDKKSKKDKKDKKAKKTEAPVRRPFDRDEDLQANVFDNAKRNAIIKRSGQLNSRFASSGMTGQFL